MSETTESTPAEPSILLTDLGDGIARITLNRPHKHNALDPDGRARLIAALQETNGVAKVVIIDGAGKSFCAGMDLGQVTDAPLKAQDDLNREWMLVQDEIRRHSGIVIASAHGHALGGGATLINSSDLAVVAEDVKIGMPEIGFGMYPGLSGPAAQLRLRPKNAAWLVLTAKRIDGRTAVDWGMANLAVPADQLEEATLQLARDVAQFDRTALEWSKKALWQIPMHITEWRAALEFGLYTNTQIQARSDAAQEGLRNFASGKRNPGQGA